MSRSSAWNKANREKMREYHRRWKEANPEKYRAAKAKWARENRERYKGQFGESNRKSRARWRGKNAHKMRAHKILNNAIKQGVLQRLSCRDCGFPDAEGHHPDYSKPLDVIWLCRQCHVAEHQRLNR